MSDALQALDRLSALVKNLHGLRLEGEPKPIDVGPHVVELTTIRAELQQLRASHAQAFEAGARLRFEIHDHERNEGVWLFDDCTYDVVEIANAFAAYHQQRAKEGSS